MQKRWLVIAAVVVLGAGGYIVYKSGKGSASTTRYVTQPAAMGTLTISVSGSGNVIVTNSANVVPTQSSGTISNLTVKIGDKVTAGQTLFDVVSDAAQNQSTLNQLYSSYLQAKQSVANAQTSATQAQIDLQTANNQNAAHPNAVLPTQIQLLQLKLNSTQAALASAQSNTNTAWTNYTSQKTAIANTAVTAPIAGTITAINVANGGTIGSTSSTSTTKSSTTSSSAAVVITDFSTLETQASINEVDIPSVAVGQKASVTFTAIPTLTLTGKVASIDSTGTSNQGVVTYNAYITFDSASPLVKPGMSTSATITTQVKQNVLLVPAAAVKTQGSNTYVQVLDSNNQPTNVTVQTGLSDATDTEITAGITAGQSVITQTITSTVKSSTSSTTTRIPGLTGGGGTFGGGGRALGN